MMLLWMGRYRCNSNHVVTNILTELFDRHSFHSLPFVSQGLARSIGTHTSHTRELQSAHHGHGWQQGRTLSASWPCRSESARGSFTTDCYGEYYTQIAVSVFQNYWTPGPRAKSSATRTPSQTLLPTTSQAFNQKSSDKGNKPQRHRSSRKPSSST